MMLKLICRTACVRVFHKRYVRRLKQALLLFALIHVNHTVSAYSDLVIFGDSLSDTGNVAQYLGADLPYPYYENRISNGPVAVDVLAARLGLSAGHSGILFFSGEGSNYAISGANAAGSDLHDLAAQFQSFLLDASQGVDAQALYLIMIGGNDVRDASVMGTAGETAAAVTAAVDAILQVLQALLDRGARNVLVSNAPDISKIPETDERALKHPGLHARAEQLSRDFNQQLREGIAQIDLDAQTRLYQFDLFEHFNAIVGQPGLHGFSNYQDPCFDFDSYSFHPQCDFERFVFFDSIHPTARVHELLGLAMHETLQGTAVPAPVINMAPIILYLLTD